MIVRPVVDEDCVRLYRWWKDPEARRWSGSRTPDREMTWDRHVEWFIDRVAKPYWYMGIADDPAFLAAASIIGVHVDQSAPIGAVRFDPRAPSPVGAQEHLPQDAMIASIVVDPAARGKGHGSALLEAAVSQSRLGSRCWASIHHLNTASRVVFERAGFKLLHHQKGEFMWWRHSTDATESIQI